MHQTVRIPVTGSEWHVVDGDGNEIPSQVQAIDQRTLQLPLLYINHHKVTKEQLPKIIDAYSNKATHVLTFGIGGIPAMGYKVFIAKGSSVKNSLRTNVEAKKSYTRRLYANDGPTTVSNGVYELTLDPATGMTATLKNIKTEISTNLEISWGWYNSSVGGCTPGIEPYDFSCDKQASGAYMFRPNTSTVFYPGKTQTPTITIQKGALVTEVYQTFSDWATHVIRLTDGSPYVEVEWTAGPIPIDTPWLPADVVGDKRFDRWGKEVIVKYKTDIGSHGLFYTDANGREMVQREYNARGPSYPTLKVSEPVAGNYYPINSMIAIQDDKNQLAVVTDVSQGGSSLKDGEIEIMVHRRIQDDDSRGVQEPLNETMCGCNDIGATPGSMGAHGHEGDGGCECAGLTMRGKHWLVFDKLPEAHQTRRELAETINFPSTLAFTPGKMPSKEFSALSTELPKNVKLVTLTNNYAEHNDGKLLLRLSHLYEAGEHPTLATPVTVDLSKVFNEPNLRITDAVETTLTGNRPLSEIKHFKWATVDGPKDPSAPTPFEERVPFKYPTVTIRPMEVRTFMASFTRKG